MPVRWKVYVGLNLVLAIPAFSLLAFWVWTYLTGRDEGSLPLVVVGGLFSISACCFLNIFFTQRFYPDKWIPETPRVIHHILFSATVLTAIALLVWCIYRFEMGFVRRADRRDQSDKWLVMLFFVYWLLLVTLLVMQLQLYRLITRNNKKSIGSMIESIGK